MVSVFNGATLDLTVSNLTVTFPELQNERTYTQALKTTVTRIWKTLQFSANNRILVTGTFKPPIDINIHKFIFFPQSSFPSLFDFPTKLIVLT